MKFEPLDRALILTKEKAAARQVQFAIGALLSGDYDAAITLAGAAEDMLPGDPTIEVTTTLLRDEMAVTELGRSFWINAVNIERNWLKHRTEYWSNSFEFTLENTPFYIFRAMRKLPLSEITGEMIEFEEWYRTYLLEQNDQRPRESS
ncbi:hypothetical protein GA830_14010 [Mesorhizobium sp. NBSH29]|uniref:hypothetical protein n=1 Tax=Mesorhizobium sp. NBSH29 TaxID=2654249 RepID=UPI0018967E8B|nr:hypothetical protein [Mesorhizobium sp. NBSH29]QPC87732.1 hypothetical protein GA830_14010 [Mesorhizobium sp. NBSH29]